MAHERETWAPQEASSGGKMSEESTHSRQKPFLERVTEQWPLSKTEMSEGKSLICMA